MEINCTAIIVAGGSGTRMGTATKKQFLELFGVPVLVHTINNIGKCKYVKDIIVVTPNEDIEYTKSIIDKFNCKKVSEVTQGGKTRSDSVKAGLTKAKNCDIIMIHDGVRPVIKEEYSNKCVEDAVLFGASVLAVTPKDTISVRDEEGNISNTPKRDNLAIIQTPQCFQFDIIKKAYDNFNPDFTDDASQVIASGEKVHLTQGDYKNIKITTIEDLKTVEEFLV